MQDEEDKIEIEYEEGGLIRNMEGDRVLPNKYIIVTVIPRQIILTSKIF